MIFKTTRNTIDMSYVNEFYKQDRKKWAIKLSGGADSALVLWMMIKIIQDNKWDDVTITVITGISESKPFNAIFAEKIMKTMTELTGFKFKEHFTMPLRTSSNEDYVQDMESFIQKKQREGIINLRFAGITSNPNPEEAAFLYPPFRDDYPFDLDLRGWSNENKKIHTEHSMRPLLNVDKRGVAMLYEELGIMNTIFPLTRSCEAVTTDFSHHCGNCWHCNERKWGFGRLE